MLEEMWSGYTQRMPRYISGYALNQRFRLGRLKLWLFCALSVHNVAPHVGVTHWFMLRSVNYCVPRRAAIVRALRQSDHGAKQGFNFAIDPLFTGNEFAKRLGVVAVQFRQ